MWEPPDVEEHELADAVSAPRFRRPEWQVD
jgi:hypothetical protein